MLALSSIYILFHLSFFNSVQNYFLDKISSRSCKGFRKVKKNSIQCPFFKGKTNYTRVTVMHLISIPPTRLCFLFSEFLTNEPYNFCWSRRKIPWIENVRGSIFYINFVGFFFSTMDKTNLHLWIKRFFKWKKCFICTLLIIMFMTLEMFRL